MSKKSIRQSKHSTYAVDADGILLVSVDGILSCEDREALRAVKELSGVGRKVHIRAFGRPVVADLDGEPLNVLAALMSVKQGRTRVLEAPIEVMNFLRGTTP